MCRLSSTQGLIIQGPRNRNSTLAAVEVLLYRACWTGRDDSTWSGSPSLRNKNHDLQLLGGTSSDRAELCHDGIAGSGQGTAHTMP